VRRCEADDPVVVRDCNGPRWHDRYAPQMSDVAPDALRKPPGEAPEALAPDLPPAPDLSSGGLLGMESVRSAGRALRRSHLIISTTSLLVASWAVTTILGFAFWFVASRSFQPHAVGLASAAIAAATLIARLTVSGLGTALAGFLPTYGGRRIQLVTTALLIAMAIGATLGLVFVGVVPRFSAEYEPLVEELPFALLFAVAAALTAAGVVGDQVMVSLRLGGLQLLRNLVFASSKLLFLVLAAGSIGTSRAILIVAVWAMGDVAAFLAILAIRRTVPRSGMRSEWATVVRLAGNAAGHHLVSAMRSGPALLMPVLVTGLLSATANAAFYVALIMTTALQVVASSATFTLYAVGSKSPTSFQRQLRVTLGLSMLIVAVGFVALAMVGPWLLSFFGETYVAQAVHSLPWLAASAFPLVVVDHWIALRRVRQRLGGAVGVLAAGAVVQVGAATYGALNGGLTGLAVGWFAALMLISATMLPEVIRATISSSPERDLAREPHLVLAQPGPAPARRVEPRLTPAERAIAPAPTTSISIFIPVRNDGAWLPGAIESVLHQTHPHWELVIGDNASTEDIGAIVARFNDPRIRYHRFDRGVSILESWNRTARLARGEWIQSLSADDRIAATCLERLAQAIEWYEPRVPRLVMALTSCRRIFTDGTSADHVWYGSKPKLPVEDRAYDPASWLHLCTEDGQPPWQVGSIALRREVIEESGGLFRTEIGLSADFETTMRVGAYGYVAYLTDELLDYTVRDDSDGPQRLLYNRARGVGDTVVGLALQNALHVHEEVRGLSACERRRLIDAIARTHLQRAAQHRVLPHGKGRSGALRDVTRAFRWSPRVVLRPAGFVYGWGAVLAPRWLLELAKDRLTARLHSRGPGPAQASAMEAPASGADGA
jgi:O-antigen/teichoic acid export membrane protein